MPKLELSFIITATVALMSFISPILTTLINNRHQLKIKKLELKQKQYEDTVIYKRNIFENYVSALSKLSAYATGDSIKEYGNYYSLAYMYLSENLQSEMSKINGLVLDHKWEMIFPLLEDLIPKIYKVLHTM